MRVLLDTATFLWMTGNPKRLSRRVKKFLVEKPGVVRELSVLSLAEIAIKRERSPGLPITNASLRSALDELDIHLLPFTAAHSYTFFDLAVNHGDPFDRLLIAQAVSESIQIVTPDESFEKYPVKVIW